MTVELDNTNFESILNTKDKLVIVDFWAPWCAPCRTMKPVLDELSTEYGKKAVIGKLNIDDNPELSSKYGIINIPTLIFFKDGEMVDRQIGGAPKNFLKEKMNLYIK